MSVIRHQTPSENIDAEAVQFFGYKIQVGYSITIGLENRNGSHAPLRDLMPITRRYNPGNSRNVYSLFEPNAFNQEIIGIVSPEFSRVEKDGLATHSLDAANHGLVASRPLCYGEPKI